MNVDEIFYDEFKRYPSPSRLKAARFIHGIYEISDNHFAVLREEDAESIEVMHFNDREGWGSLRHNVTSLARRFNQTSIETHLNSGIVSPHGLEPFIFYDPAPADSKYSYLRFSAIEGHTITNNDVFVRRIIKNNFGHYRIKQTVEALPEKCFVRGDFKCDKFLLTLRTIFVKVPKQELTYHTLIEKFSIKTINI
jgi:hypothetical protein